VAKAGNKKKAPDVSKLSFEEALEEIETLIDQIEGGEIGLQESLEAYERGAKLLARSRSLLEQVEQRVEELDDEVLGDESERQGR